MFNYVLYIPLPFRLPSRPAQELALQLQLQLQLAPPPPPPPPSSLWPWSPSSGSGAGSGSIPESCRTPLWSPPGRCCTRPGRQPWRSATRRRSPALQGLHLPREAVPLPLLLGDLLPEGVPPGPQVVQGGCDLLLRERGRGAGGHLSTCFFLAPSFPPPRPSPVLACASLGQKIIGKSRCGAPLRGGTWHWAARGWARRGFFVRLGADQPAQRNGKKYKIGTGPAPGSDPGACAPLACRGAREGGRISDGSHKAPSSLVEECIRGGHYQKDKTKNFYYVCVRK